MELLDNLKKKHKFELLSYLETFGGGDDLTEEETRAANKLIDKHFSETAEAVARSMVGDSRLSAMEGVEEHVIMNYGYNERIAEEQAKCDDIINSLKE